MGTEDLWTRPVTQHAFLHGTLRMLWVSSGSQDALTRLEWHCCFGLGFGVSI